MRKHEATDISHRSLFFGTEVCAEIRAQGHPIPARVPAIVPINTLFLLPQVVMHKESLQLLEKMEYTSAQVRAPDMGRLGLC